MVKTARGPVVLGCIVVCYLEDAGLFSLRHWLAKPAANLKLDAVSAHASEHLLLDRMHSRGISARSSSLPHSTCAQQEYAGLRAPTPVSQDAA